MKKILFFSLLAGMALAGCTNDELVNDNAFGGNNEYIKFTYHSDNMTRAENLQNSHYEFGVFANNGDEVMNNYLVAYGDNALYNSLIAGATTYGDPTSQVDGLSYWFYESLGKTADTYVHTPYNTPDLDQDLKYWDKSKASYDFWAYAPYTNKVAGAEGKQNALKVAFDSGNFTFTNLSSFYTNPQTQIESADVEAAGLPSSANYNKEMINYNEGLYAYNNYIKNEYGTDVPFLFQHINAKVNLKFYSDIKGYNVEIIDVKSDADYDGIQLSPATTLQSRIPMTKTQPKLLPAYFAKADVEVSGIAEGGAGTIAVGNGATLDSVTTDNLKFQIPTGNIGITNASATASPTTLYVLPNYAGSAYITPAALVEPWMGEDYDGVTDKWNSGTGLFGPSQNVADSTGYTLHLSYIMHPTDGSADITVYDARVFVPASACQWEASKAYTYVFKITKNTNGTTDPNEMDPATPTEPWIDVTDPRVGNEPGLQPIVFDGVTVTDYVDGTTTEYPITEMTLGQSLENAFKNLKSIFSNGGTQNAMDIYNTGIASPNEGTEANPYAFTLNTVTSDFIDYTGTDVNNNNVYKDLQALFQSLYNEDGIKELVYDGNTYTRSGSGSATPGLKPAVCWVYGGKSIESVIATELYGTGDWIYNTTDNTTAYAVKVVSNKPIESALYFTLTASNTADENVYGTALKRKVANFNPLSAGKLEIVGANTEYTLTLNAVDGDLMWPAYPDNVDANNNNVYKDIKTFFTGLIESPNKATYSSQEYTNPEYLANAIAANVFTTAQALFGTPGTNLVSAGDVVLFDGTNTIIVHLKLNLTVK